MERIYASFLVKLSELRKNAAEIRLKAGMKPVAVMQNGETVFYLLAPPLFEQLLKGQEPSAQTQDGLMLPAVTDTFEPGLAVHPCFQSLVPRLIELEESRILRGELSEKALKITRYRLAKHVLPFFGGRPVDTVDYELLESFVNMLSGLGLRGISIGQYLVIVRKVLNLAYSANLIDRMPRFPKVKAKSVSRGAFNLDEYRVLLKTAWQLRGQPFPLKTRSKLLRLEGLNPETLVMYRDMHRLIGFMVNSFVRPSDIRIMRHRYVEVVRGEHAYLRLSLPETKRHDKPIVTLRSAVGIYERLLIEARNNGFGRPDDFVFLPQFTNRNYAMRVIGFLFNWILEETGLKAGPHGKGRTLYSLRHTAITFRLLYGQGIDVLTLARNARTSVEMIERHYASTLHGEMNIGLLQSKRKNVSQ